jgi:uncharacterized membrane protein
MSLRLKSLKEFMLLSLVVSLSLCGLAGIIILILGSFGTIEQKVLGTTATFAAFSILGLCCSFLAGKRKYLFVSYTGIATCAAGLLYAALFIWVELDRFSDYFGKTMATFAVLAVLLAHTSLILLVPAVKVFLKAALISTICSTAAVLVLALFIIWFGGKINISYNLLFRIMGIFGILAVLGTISVPVLSKINKQNY